MLTVFFLFSQTKSAKENQTKCVLSHVVSSSSHVSILVIVLTKSAPASILSYLLHEAERKIFAEIYLVWV